MATEWFCIITGKQFGPLSSKQIRTMAASGRLAPDDQVRRGADGSWVAASRVKGLFTEDGAPTGLTDSTDLPEPMGVIPAPETKPPAKKPPAKAAPKPKPTRRPAAKPAAVPVAQPVAKVPRAQAAAAPPAAPARASGSVSGGASGGASPNANPLGIVAESRTAAAAGYGPEGPQVPDARKRKKKQNVVVVLVLLLVIAGLGCIPIVMSMVGDGSDKPSAQLEEKTAAMATTKTTGKTPGPAPPAPPTDPGGDPPPVADTKWYDASTETITRDDVRVKILSARLGRVQCTQPTGRTARSSSDNLQITVEIENAHPEKAKSYQGWCTLGATLRTTDNRSRQYAQWSPPGEATVNGQIQEGSIAPAESIEDLLAFRAPEIDEKLKYVRLELPAEAFGGQGTLRFEIPADWIGEVHDTRIDPVMPGPDPVMPGPVVPPDGPPDRPFDPVMPPPPDPNEEQPFDPVMPPPPDPNEERPFDPAIGPPPPNPNLEEPFGPAVNPPPDRKEEDDS